MSHGSEHSLPSSDYEVDAAFEAAMAESAVHPSLPATSTVRASEQLAGLESEMTSLKGEFLKCGVDDVFAFVKDKSTAGGRARRLVTDVLQLQLHALADDYCIKKTMRERAAMQKAKYDAAKWPTVVTAFTRLTAFARSNRTACPCGKGRPPSSGLYTCKAC